MAEQAGQQGGASLERKSPFKATKSAAEMVAMDTEGYADEGLAQHKGPKHLEEHWHKGYAGLRKEGEDEEEEAQRLRELEERAGKGLVQRATEAMTSTASAAVGKAGEVVQAAKEAVGLGPK